jgi:hypothetical protein
MGFKPARAPDDLGPTLMITAPPRAAAILSSRTSSGVSSSTVMPREPRQISPAFYDLIDDGVRHIDRNRKAPRLLLVVWEAPG